MASFVVDIIQVLDEDKYFERTYLLMAKDQKRHQFSFAHQWMANSWLKMVLDLEGSTFDEETSLLTVNNFSFEEWIKKIDGVTFSVEKGLGFTLQADDEDIHCFFLTSEEKDKFVRERLRLIKKANQEQNTKQEALKVLNQSLYKDLK
jgi:hypothetical protein